MLSWRGRSAERQVSWVTGKACKRALEDLGHRVKVIDPDEDLPLRLWQERQAGCDFVWIALHGPGGEDGVVQGMLDWLGLPYQGSGPLASALAMDKLVSKQIFRAARSLPPIGRFGTTKAPSLGLTVRQSWDPHW